MDENGDLMLRLLLEEDDGKLARPASVRDGFDEFVEEIELEMAGGPVLPPRQTRLRSSERDDDLAKMGSNPSDRNKAALAQFIKRRLALGESLEALIAHAAAHSTQMANELRTVVAEGWLEIVGA